MLISRLTKATFAIEKKLFVYDCQNPKILRTMCFTEHSGIRATIFGATGFVGTSIAKLLGEMASSLIMPVSLQAHYRHEENAKQLRILGPTNKTWVDYYMDFAEDKLINRLVANSNVVINLVGPRTRIKKLEDFEFANIEIAEKIARACTKNGVHRLIHFSAAGAEPDSESLDFRTKFTGEAAVRAEFPNATIFRPCLMYGWNDHFVEIIRRQLYFFMNRFVIAYDDLQTKKQPIKNDDIAQCVINALKLQETKGKTYQLGGPQVMTLLQCHEIIFNLMNFKPHIGYINKQIAMEVSKLIYNWDFLSMEKLRKYDIEEVVKEDRYLTIKDLMVEPVNFKNGVYDVVKDFAFNITDKDEDYEA